MTRYIAPEEISAFSIAADIHQNGGVVRVNSESEFQLDYQGVNISIHLSPNCLLLKATE